MSLDIIITADGSKTIYSSAFDATYHSRHGAVSESRHIFIKNGLQYIHELSGKHHVSILEVGYGTGLNAALSMEYALLNRVKLIYRGIDLYELPDDILLALNYKNELNQELKPFYDKINQTVWNEIVQINPYFTIEKAKADFKHWNTSDRYDVVFFDAFSPRQAPDMWTPDIFRKIYDCLNPGAAIVTFCAQGQFKRDLKSAGFYVERLPGAPGKREMTRGLKR